MKPTTPLRFAGIDFVRTGQLKQNGLVGVLTFVNSGREIRESDRDDQRSWRELEYVGGEETRQRISSARRQPSGTQRGTDPMLSVWRRDSVDRRVTAQDAASTGSTASSGAWSSLPERGSADRRVEPLIRPSSGLSRRMDRCRGWSLEFPAFAVAVLHELGGLAAVGGAQPGAIPFDGAAGAIGDVTKQGGLGERA